MNNLKCTIIFCSPHSDGNCSKILKNCMENINSPLEVEIYDAYKLNATPCTDCGCCKKSEKCACSDLDKLYASIENSELLIIVSPVYNMSFPSPMKAILDRFQRYYNARFSLGIKPAIKQHRKAVLLACAGSEKETGEFMINQLRLAFSVMNTELCAIAVINGLDENEFDDTDVRLTDCTNKINNIISTL